MGHHVLFGELLRLLLHDHRAALVAKLLFQQRSIFADQVVDLAGVGQQVFQVVDRLDQLAVLLLNLAGFQLGQAAELQVEYGLRLPVGEVEWLGHQLLFGVLGRVCAADRLDHRVQHVDRLQQAF